MSGVLSKLPELFFQCDSLKINSVLGHPRKMFRFPSPDRPIFLGKKKFKKIRITFKEKTTLVYKHTILSY